MFSVLFLTFLFIVLSCSNVVDNESAASYEQKKKEHTTVSNTETAVETKSNTPAAPVKKYATISGDLELNGAYPVSVINRIENDDPARPESDYTEDQGRSALPVVPANSWYFIKATCNGTDYVYGEVIQATRAYSIQLELGYTWTIIAGIRASETDVNSAVFLQDSYPLEITENSISDTDHTFFLKPLTSGGNGIIDLKMDIPDDDTIGYVKATCLSDNKDNWKNGDVAPLVELANDATDGKVAKLNIPAIKSGSYEVLFTFHSSATETFPLFTTVQIINVFENMTTSTWADNGNASVINNETKSFKIDTNVLKKYSLTQIYVGSYPGTYGDGLPGKAPSDSNEGTPYSPFSSLNKALSIIDTQNQPANNYTIHITGETTDTANNTISTDRAASITLAGVNSSTSIIRGHGTSSPVLSITTSKPVTFKNIQITGGNNSSGNGGALYLADNTNVTLADGAVISGNTAAKGGAVYVSPQADFKIKGSAKLQFAASDAAGRNDVYLAKDDSHKAKITVAGSLTQSAVALITPEDWSRGTQIIQTLGAAVDTVLSKFTISDRDFSAKKLNSNVTTGIIDAPIFIASQANSTYGIGNPADTEDSHGSKSSPFASIEYALKELTNPDFDFTFTIYGNVCGNQIIQNITTENNAASLTLEGFKPAGSTTSDASLSGDGSSTLTVDSGVPVIIKNLKITGGEGTGNGSNNKGGGIYLTNGTVKLADGAHITGNTAYRGGGVYVEDGARLFMYGSSLIGDLKSTTITSAPEDEDDASNSARDGGGLYNNGEVYLGYEDWTNESNNVIHALDAGYGISHNYSSSDAGGIMNGKIIRMASGTIGLNRGVAGGGIMNDNSDIAGNIFSGGTIEDNIAESGGGIYSNNSLTLNGTFTIQNNEASDAGGAVYAVSITLCDSVSIPYGVNNTKAEKKNDVNCWGSTPVSIGTNLAAHDSDSPIFITPNAWTRETTVLGAANASLLTSNISCFATTDEDFTIQQKGTTTEGVLKADIFVAGSADSSYKIGSPADTTTTRGTKKYPFASLKYALEQICTDSNTDYTIKMFGTLRNTEIPDSGFSAKSLTIEGIRGWTEGMYNTITGDLFKGTTTSGSEKSALVINSTVPVTLKKLGIYDGGGTVESEKHYGGGLYIKKSGAYVTLADGIGITGNQLDKSGETYGGGVYIAEGANCYICKDALIGTTKNKNGQTNTERNAYNAFRNVAHKGAGIYNAGNLYLGYKYENGSRVEEECTSGIRGNGDVQVNGGGLYTTGTFLMKSGIISSNEAWYGAGIYSEAASKDNAIFEGGSISSNTATYQGSGINIAAGKYFYIKDGTIQSNNNRYEDRLGGAVYCAGTLAIGGNAYFQNGTVAESKNDIAVANTGKIEVESALEKEGIIATLTMAEWTRGYEVLIPGSSLTSGITDAIKNKFVTIDEDFTFALKGTGAATTGALNAPIYVASTATTDETRIGNAGVTSGARGTKAKPYASITAGIAACTDSSLPFTIYVDGTVKSAHKIVSTEAAPVNAKSITITKHPEATGGTYKAVLSGTTNNRTLEINAPSNDFEITMTNILITGGAPTNGNGGGILLTKGTLKLGEGVQVTGNYAPGNGGGISVGANGTLFMYDDAIVGDTTEAIAEYSDTDSTKYANRAQNLGGGIYSAGNVYIGYSGINSTTHVPIPSPMTTGGVRRNFNNANGGGGIYVYDGLVEIGSGNVSYNQTGNCGGGIHVQKGTVNLDAVCMTSNKSQNLGGAIYTHSSYTCNVNINGTSEIIKNSAYGSGGAIYISSTGSLTMTAGTIGGSNSSDANIADSDSDGTGDGGAIYNAGTFNVSGSAYVSSGTLKINDVYLPSNKKVTIDSTWSGSQASNKMTLTPSTWARGSQVLAGTKAADYYTYFNTSDSEWSVGYKESSWTLTDDLKTRIGADIYVAGSENRASGISAPSETASERIGTKLKPFNSIEEGVKACWITTLPFTVKFSGTITGTAQTIPAGSTSTGGLASAITIEGVQGNSKDIINRNLSTATDSGTALTINTATPVTIKKIKITGGYNKNASGGGIRANVAGASLTLGEGALVTANYLSVNDTEYSGGGVYVEGTSESPATLIMESDATISGNDSDQGKGGGVGLKYATLCMTGTALIGDKDATSAATGDSGKHSNSAQSGGGVYVGTGSKLRLGYATPTATTGTSLDAAYGIRYNYVYNAGGGVLVASGSSVEIASGSISCNGTIANAAYKNGGGIYLNETATLTMSGGTIAKNKAYDGGGVYLFGNTSSGSSIVMSGGTIGDSSSGVTSAATGADEKFSNYAVHDGGGIYAATAKNTVDLNAGNVSYNYSAGQGGGIWTAATTYFNLANAKYNGAVSGGGVYTNGTFTMDNANGAISSNKASSKGGGVYVEGGTFTMSAGTIGDKNATDAAESDASKHSNSAGTYGGGGIYVNDGTVSLNGGTVAYNYCATASGGGIYFNGGTLTVKNQVKYNSAYTGGGVTVNADGCTLDGAVFTKNVATSTAATGGGGGAYVKYGKTLNVKGSFAMSNPAKNTNDIFVAWYATNSQYGWINVSGSLSGSGTVAMITPSSYNDNKTIVKAGSGVSISTVSQRFSVLQDTSSTKTWLLDTSGNLKGIWGTKLTPDKAGDVVYSDGSAMDGSSATIKNPAKAIAVIFYKSGSTMKGLGLKESPDSGTKLGLVEPVCQLYSKAATMTSSASDGSENMTKVKSLSDANTTVNFQTNYPGFYWASAYSSSATNLGVTYSSGWYIPAKDEMSALISKLNVINPIIEKIGTSYATKVEPSNSKLYCTSTWASNGWVNYAKSTSGLADDMNALQWPYQIRAIRTF
ncbi:hypothetical protein [Treponema bryantii]|uniref:hypothetical protein n=1 Tax=Treponema bryantii TaxID=163 RepID=UPI0003F83D22|nr:hypothetical protein [Treponema bryantii]